MNFATHEDAQLALTATQKGQIRFYDNRSIKWEVRGQNSGIGLGTSGGSLDFRDGNEV